MNKPDRREIMITAVPIFAAEAVVVVALFMGAVITINGHALWAYLVGMAP